MIRLGAIAAVAIGLSGCQTAYVDNSPRMVEARVYAFCDLMGRSSSDQEMSACRSRFHAFAATETGQEFFGSETVDNIWLQANDYCVLAGNDRARRADCMKTAGSQIADSTRQDLRLRSLAAEMRPTPAPAPSVTVNMPSLPTSCTTTRMGSMTNTNCF